LPSARPARVVQPVAPVTPVQERPTAPRYLPYGPDRPHARLAAGTGPVLAGLDCYA